MTLESNLYTCGSIVTLVGKTGKTELATSPPSSPLKEGMIHIYIYDITTLFNTTLCKVP